MSNVTDEERALSSELLEFIKLSPTAYQAVDSVKSMVEKVSGAQCLVRNGSSLIAYKMPKEKAKGFRIVCAHTDSPMFKIKENAETKDGNGYIKLNVEKYGGMIVNTWLDRPLSVAGRVVYEDGTGLKSVNVDLEKPLFIIPSLAIHMSRGNDEKSLSIQTDLQPIGDAGLMELVAKKVSGVVGNGVTKDCILGTDIYVYSCQPGCVVGSDESYICAPRLDDLQCVFAATKAWVEADSSEYIDVLAVFDNEEVGSLSVQGASSDFLKSVLEEISEQLELTKSEFREILDESFMVSADNAHAVHPNHPEKADPTNKPRINEGLVIKYHGGQKYTTDAYTGAMVKKLCKDNNIPYQTYHNNSDIAGGSTLGNLVMANVSIPAVDIGAPQLAMHSVCETVGTKDTLSLLRFMKCFYSA